jgi:predicted Zn finger-like uncharacterized protein
MKESISCPHCGTSFNVARENEGKRAKCAKCQQSFTIKFPESQPEYAGFPDPIAEPVVPSPSFAESISPPAIPKTKPVAAQPAGSKSLTIPKWAIMAAPAFVTLIAGYFIGREHVKYEIRSTFAKAADVFSKGLGNGPLGSKKPGGAQPNEGSKSSSQASAPAEKPRQFNFGEKVQEKGFSINLKNARIEAPALKDMMGEDTKGKDPVLILSFDFANTDDRRILRFKEDNPFLSSHFKLRDDVDNVIRGVSYGVGAKPKGALTSADDIAPGATAGHVKFFSVPPPKTQFLILTIDLECLGGEGEVEFKIPANAIQQ